MANEVDISETTLREENPEVFAALLRCHSSWRHAGKPKGCEGDFNIIWATNDYENLGIGYSFHDRINPDLITGDANGHIIRPRVLKSVEEQNKRVKDKAEVFTPSWVCNAQNNLVDEAWFGRPDVFNVMDPITHTWTHTSGKIEFSDEKTWLHYVNARRLEMCCGEAPYLVSRYDPVSGEPIPVSKRIGLLDRKLRVISENVDSPEEWINMAFNALKATYGFEWQGDSLLLAREALLYTVYDFFEEKFHMEFPRMQKLSPKSKFTNSQYAAYIISWNIFQMDGLKLVVPESCGFENTLFGRIEKPCNACKTGTRTGHNGIPALIAQWKCDTITTPSKVEPFSESLKHPKKK